jgi:MoaA/NifB/PqqE/SkfB family radical SAM enzyme
MVTEEVVGRLSAHKGLSVSVSLDGPQALHDRIRGEGSYRQVIGCIDRALDAGIDIFIFTTVCRSLLPDLANFAEETYRKFPDLNCLILIQLIRVTDDTFDLSDEFLDPDDFLQMVWVASLLNLCGLKTSVLRNPLIGIVSRLLRIPWAPPTHPLYRYGSMFVMANRNITLAHSSRGSFGTYEPGMIRKVLVSDAYRKATGPDRATCLNCKYYELCMDHGMIRPSESDRDMHPDVPYCQRVIQRALLGFKGWT